MTINLTLFTFEHAEFQEGLPVDSLVVSRLQLGPDPSFDGKDGVGVQLKYFN